MMESTVPQNEDQPRVKYVFVCGFRPEAEPASSAAMLHG